MRGIDRIFARWLGHQAGTHQHQPNAVPFNEETVDGTGAELIKDFFEKMPDMPQQIRELLD